MRAVLGLVLRAQWITHSIVDCDTTTTSGNCNHDDDDEAEDDGATDVAGEGLASIFAELLGPLGNFRLFVLVT